MKLFFISSFLNRNIAFCVILCRVGLRLDLKILRNLKWEITKLSALPCLIEAFVFAAIAYWLLKMPFLWALLLGCILRFKLVIKTNIFNTHSS
jgi:NhaP-type Na+/H+ or K+/H+ antiporter